MSDIVREGQEMSECQGLSEKVRECQRFRTGQGQVREDFGTGSGVGGNMWRIFIRIRGLQIFGDIFEEFAGRLRFK